MRCEASKLPETKMGTHEAKFCKGWEYSLLGQFLAVPEKVFSMPHRLLTDMEITSLNSATTRDVNKAKIRECNTSRT